MFRFALVPVSLVMVLIASLRAAAVPAVTATLPVGPRPVTVAVDRSSRVYVADAELRAVVQVDGARGTVLGPIDVGGQPSSMVIDDPGRRLFVGNTSLTGAAVTVIDLGSGRAREFLRPGTRVQSLAFDPEVNQLYIATPDAGELLIVNGTTAEVVDRLPVGGVPAAVAVNERNGEVAVAVQGTAPVLALLDPADRAGGFVRVPVPEGQPLQVAVDTSTDKFFVTRGGANPALLVLRPGSSQFDNAIPVAPGPSGLAIDSRTSRIYLSHAAVSQATVIDGATGTPLAVLPLGDSANHAAVDPTSSPTRVYIVDTANGLLSILTDQ
jgi:DNA-binding beta-propeller fold protein YncE